MDQDIESSRDNPDPDELILRVKARVRAGQVAEDVWDDCYSRFMGINRTDARCLDIIDRHGRVTAGQLAAEAGLTTGAVTVAVDRLVAAGYAARQRDEGDRRKVWIALTPLAGRLGGHVFAHFRLLVPMMRRRFTPDQLAAIASFLEVSARINLEQARLLETRIAPDADAASREAAARAFRQDADRLMRAMLETLEAGLPFCDPAEH